MLLDMILIAFLVFLAVIALAVAVEIWSGGSGRIRVWRKMGYGFSAARNAELKSNGAMTSAHAKAGIEFSSRDGKIVDYKSTRTISDSSI